MTRIKGFPDAPDGAYLSEEGWLVVHDEAWTQDEWAHRSEDDVRRTRHPYKYATDTERVAARRRSHRDYNRRKREAA